MTPGHPVTVETVARRGYRLIAAVRRLDAPPMLAVLPFTDLSPEPEDYFCAGLTEELIAQIARTNAERPGVIAWTSAMICAHRTGTIGEISRSVFRISSTTLICSSEALRS